MGARNSLVTPQGVQSESNETFFLPLLYKKRVFKPHELGVDLCSNFVRVKLID